MSGHKQAEPRGREGGGGGGVRVGRGGEGGVSGVFLVSVSERIAPAHVTCARHGFCQAPAVVDLMGMGADGVARFHFSR